MIVLSLVGVAGGFLSGLVGVGGGIIFVTALVYVMGWDIREAVAASLAIVISTAAVGVYPYVGFDEIATLPSLIVGSILGALLGVRVRDRVPAGAIRVGFGALMVVIAVQGMFDTGLL